MAAKSDTAMHMADRDECNTINIFLSGDRGTEARQQDAEIDYLNAIWRSS